MNNHLSYDFSIFEIKLWRPPANNQETNFANKKNKNDEQNVRPASYVDPKSTS